VLISASSTSLPDETPVASSNSTFVTCTPVTAVPTFSYPIVLVLSFSLNSLFSSGITKVVKFLNVTVVAVTSDELFVATNVSPKYRDALAIFEISLSTVNTTFSTLTDSFLACTSAE